MTLQRRVAVVTVYALLSLLLVQALLADVPEMRPVLEGVSGPVVERLPLPSSVTMMLLVVGVAAASAAAAFLTGPRAPVVLAVLTAAGLTVLTAPLARLTWFPLLFGGTPPTHGAGPAVWLAALALLLLTMAEAAASARETALDDLRRRGVPKRDVEAAATGTLAHGVRVGVFALALGLPAAVVAASSLGPAGIPFQAALIVVPAAVGLGIGVFLWWNARAGSA